MQDSYLSVVDEELAATCVGEAEEAVRLQVQAPLLPRHLGCKLLGAEVHIHLHMSRCTQ